MNGNQRNLKGDSLYEAPAGRLWVCRKHMVTSTNKFNGWPEGCDSQCLLDAEQYALIDLELDVKTGKLLEFRPK